MIKRNLCAIISLLALAGCLPKASTQGTAISAIHESLEMGIKQNLAVTPYATLPEPLLDTLLPAVQIHEPDRRGSPDRRFNVTATDVPAKSFFSGLVNGTEYNIITHPSVSGSISLTLNDVTVLDVLDMVQNVYGYSYTEKDQNIQVLPAVMQAKTFKINYLDMIRKGGSETRVSSTGLNTDNSDDSDSSGSSSSSSSNSDVNSQISTNSKADLWSELKSTIETIAGTGEGRKVAVSPFSGLIVVQAMPQELKQVEDYLRQAEQALNKQVILEAKVLEVELNDRHRTGINWATVSNRLRVSQLGGNIHNDPIIPNDVPVSIPSATGNPTTVSVEPQGILPTTLSTAGVFGGVFSLGFNSKTLASFIEALSAQGNVQVLSSPRVSTMNNQKALIKVGSDEFFVTNVTNSTVAVAGGGVSAPTVEFDSFFSGIALDVTPQISERNVVTLHVHPTVSNVTQKNKTVTLNSGDQIFPLANSTVRESDSIVRARNGELVVIGGLMQERTAEQVSGVPWMKDIPILGSAFRHTRQESKKSELVILIRPLIVEGDKWIKDLDTTRKRFRALDKGFHYGGNVELYGSLGEQ